MKKYISTQTYRLNNVGLCFIATNDESQSRENLCKSLIGEFVIINGSIWKVRNVETFCVPIIRKDMQISLLVDETDC